MCLFKPPLWQLHKRVLLGIDYRSYNTLYLYSSQTFPLPSSQKSIHKVLTTTLRFKCATFHLLVKCSTNWATGAIPVPHWYHVNEMDQNLCFTNLQARSADLPASPAGLLGRFAPSGFALRAHILLTSLAHFLRFALTKIFEKKKCVSINSKCSETRKNAKKKFFYPFWPIRCFTRSEVQENFRKK